MSFEIIDADGHVTETWEQIARYLEPPYSGRSPLTPFFPQDGWDRRLLGTKGNWAGDGRAWVEALDAGGMSLAVLYPTLGLFMPFLRDAEWAVALCRAYNTMLHGEVTSQQLAPERRRAVAAPGPVRRRPRAGARGGGVRVRGRHGLRRQLLPARACPLRSDLRSGPAPARPAGGPRGRHGHGHRRPRALSQVHPGSYVLACLCPASRRSRR